MYKIKMAEFKMQSEVYLFHAHALVVHKNPYTGKRFYFAICQPYGLDRNQEEAIFKTIFGNDCEIIWGYNFVMDCVDNLFILPDDLYNTLEFKEGPPKGNERCWGFVGVADSLDSRGIFRDVYEAFWKWKEHEGVELDPEDTYQLFDDETGKHYTSLQPIPEYPLPVVPPTPAPNA